MPAEQEETLVDAVTRNLLEAIAGPLRAAVHAAVLAVAPRIRVSHVEAGPDVGAPTAQADAARDAALAHQGPRPQAQTALPVVRHDETSAPSGSWPPDDSQ